MVRDKGRHTQEPTRVCRPACLENRFRLAQDPPALEACPPRAGLGRALLSRAHSEGPGNVLTGGGASAPQPHDVPLAKEPEHEAQEEKPLGALLHCLRSLRAPVPRTASLPSRLPQGRARSLNLQETASWEGRQGLEDRVSTQNGLGKDTFGKNM